MPSDSCSPRRSDNLRARLRRQRRRGIAELHHDLVTTAIVVETVFAWPGLGRLAYDGITSRDFPVIQAVVLTTAAIVAAVNLGVDCLYALIDPRIRYGAVARA